MNTFGYSEGKALDFSRIEDLAVQLREPLKRLGGLWDTVGQVSFSVSHPLNEYSYGAGGGGAVPQLVKF